MRAPGRRADRSGPGAVRRVAMVVALLVLAVLGSAARQGTRLSATGMLNGRAGPVTVVFGIGLVAAACVALAVMTMTLARLRRSGKFTWAGQPATAWQRTLVFLATLAVIAVLAIVLAKVLGGAHGIPKAHRIPKVPARRHPQGRRAAPGDVTTLVVALTAVAAVAAVAAAAVSWWRHRRTPVSPGLLASEPDSPLAVAVRAGSAALDTVIDARRAIVSCYAAMEDALATAGSPRRAADTPEELLGRAHRDGILRTPAASQLTELFREARFSPHILGDTERDAAALALGDISRELGGQP
jgi:hypothetical protein